MCNWSNYYRDTTTGFSLFNLESAIACAREQVANSSFVQMMMVVACELELSSQFKHSPRAFDDEFYRSENTDEYSICMTVINLIDLASICIA